MKSKLSFTLAFLAYTIVFSGNINAALINYSYNGTIDTSTYGGDSNVSVISNFTLDSDLTNYLGNNCSGEFCNATTDSIPWSININGKDHLPLNYPSSIQIYNNASYDLFQVSIFIAPIEISDNFEITSVGFRLEDTDASMMNNMHLPLTLDSILEAEYIQPFVYIHEIGDSIVHRSLTGVINDIHVTPVPIPPSFLLFLSGIAVLLINNITRRPSGTSKQQLAP